MIVKTEEDPLKEADIMVENFVDHGRLLIVNSLSKHLPHPFLLPAAHKIVNCLGKQAVGNLGVEQYKSRGEDYRTLLCYVHGQMGSTKYSIEFIRKELLSRD